MFKVFSKQAMDIMAYLVKEGYSRKNPFVPKKKPFFIQSVCELPGKYQYFYDTEIVALWPDSNALYAKVKDTDNTVREIALLDNEPEESDWENGLGTYDGPELWYWDFNALSMLLFKTESWLHLRWGGGRLQIPFEGDFYSIETVGGKKQIHINGTLWKSDDEWRHSEYVFLIIPLEEFIAEYAKNGSEYVDSLYSEAKTGISEFTKAQAEKCIQNYFNGCHPEGRLDWADITMDTPDGNYYVEF